MFCEPELFGTRFRAWSLTEFLPNPFIKNLCNGRVAVFLKDCGKQEWQNTTNWRELHGSGNLPTGPTARRQWRRKRSDPTPPTGYDTKYRDIGVYPHRLPAVHKDCGKIHRYKRRHRTDRAKLPQLFQRESHFPAEKDIESSNAPSN